MQIAEARRAGTPDWINVRTALGAILFLISLVTGSVVLGSAEPGMHVWAAARDLPAGAALQDADLELVTVDLPPDQTASYLGGSTGLTGSTLLKPLRRGELVPAAWVTDQETPSTRAIAIPLAPEHAVGGDLRPGDRVDVLATLRSPRGVAETTVLVEGAEVEDLLRSEALVMEAESFAGITLSVAPEDVTRIAFALQTADIDIVRVEGSPTTTTTITTVTAEDL